MSTVNRWRFKGKLSKIDDCFFSRSTVWMCEFVPHNDAKKRTDRHNTQSEQFRDLSKFCYHNKVFHWVYQKFWRRKIFFFLRIALRNCEQVIVYWLAKTKVEQNEHSNTERIIWFVQFFFFYTRAKATQPKRWIQFDQKRQQQHRTT